jgi:hypothetical protein
MKKNQTPAKVKNKKPVLSKWGVTAIISLAVFLLQNPLLITLPNFGLDPSWQLGLFWAVKKGVALGSDFAFTYGPLHFLSHGVMNLGDFPMLMREFLIYAAIYFLTIFIIVYQLVAMFYRQPWKTYSTVDKALLIGGLLFFTFMKMHLGETILIINCILFIRLIFEIDCTKTNRKAYWGNIFLNIALLNVLCMLKFSYAIAACTLLILACAGLIYKKKAVLMACILPLFILLNVLFWLSCGQPLSALPDYYSSGFDISAGYTEAMLVHNPDIELRYGLFSLLVIVLVGAFSLWFFFKKDVYHAAVLFILLPVLFLAFKNAFVRADGHAKLFFFQLTPVVIFLILFSVGNIRLLYKRVWPVFIAIIAIATMTAIPVIESGDPQVIKTQKNPLIQLFSPKTADINRAKAAIRAALPPLSESYLKEANRKTVDIFPWEISLLYAYDLDWSPRPVVQSYSAYTSRLDSLNAAHFKGSEAPDNIIYQYGSIDGRYLLFDEPATFRTILENYELLSPENYLILQRRQEEITCYYTPLTNGICPVGTEIEVPQLPGQHIYCNIDLSLSFFGKVMNLFYKPSILYFCFHIKGAPQPVMHRFLRQTATNGLFVSKYAGNLFDIYQIIRKEYVQNIERIQILTNHPEYYAPEMKYEFYYDALPE